MEHVKAVVRRPIFLHDIDSMEGGHSLRPGEYQLERVPYPANSQYVPDGGKEDYYVVADTALGAPVSTWKHYQGIELIISE